MQRVDQLVAAEHASRPAHQRVQDPELSWRDRNRSAVERHLDGAGVEHEAIGHQHRLVLARRAVASKLHPDPRHELARAERLDDVVIGADVEADHLVGVTAARGEEHDGHVRHLAQLTAYLEAVEAGQHHVEQHEVGSGSPSHGERLGTIRGERGSVALAFHVQTKEVPDLGIVVDDQHSRHGCVGQYVHRVTTR